MTTYSSSSSTPKFYLVVFLVLCALLTYILFGQQTPNTAATTTQQQQQNADHILAALPNLRNNKNEKKDTTQTTATTPPPPAPRTEITSPQTTTKKSNTNYLQNNIVDDKSKSKKNLIVDEKSSSILVRDSSSPDGPLRTLYSSTTSTSSSSIINFKIPPHITEIALEGGTNIRAELTDWLCGSYDTMWERDGARNTDEIMFARSSSFREKKSLSFKNTNRALIAAEPIPKPFGEMKQAVGDTCTKAFFSEDEKLFEKKVFVSSKKVGRRKIHTKDIWFNVDKEKSSQVVSEMMTAPAKHFSSTNSNSNKSLLPVFLPLNAAFAPKHSIFPLHLSQLSACSSLNSLNNDYSKHVIGKESKMMAKVDNVCSQNAKDGATVLQVPTIPLFDLISKIPERVRVIVVAIDAQGFDWPVMQSLLPQKQHLRVANIVSECQDLPKDHDSFITKGAISCSEMISCVEKFFSSSNNNFEFVKCRENNARSREYNCLWTNRELVKLTNNNNQEKKSFDYSESELEAIEAALGHGPDTKTLKYDEQQCMTKELAV